MTATPASATPMKKVPWLSGAITPAMAPTGVRHGATMSPRWPPSHGRTARDRQAVPGHRQEPLALGGLEVPLRKTDPARP